jgi:DNA repair protein RadA/Sms
VLRATKNRFGSTQEIGLFEMGGTGLQQLDEGGIAIDTSGPGLPGSVLTATMAGTRCLPVEIQALTSTGFLGSAKRRGTGIDANRLAMLIAVLEKHGGQRLADQDIFAAVAGGIRVTEPAADLALALAIAGAHHGRALRPGTVVLGEVGLTGEIRSVRGIDQRLRELARRGAVAAVIPRSQADLATGLGLEIHAIAGIGAGLSTLE